MSFALQLLTVLLVLFQGSSEALAQEPLALSFVDAHQQNHSLTILESTQKEIYGDGDFVLRFEGIAPEEKTTLLTTLLPQEHSQQHEIDNAGAFPLEIEIQNPAFGEHHQLFFSTADGSNKYSFSFIPYRTDDLPTPFGTVFAALGTSQAFWLFLVLLILCTVLTQTQRGTKDSRGRSVLRLGALVILAMALLSTSYQIAINALKVRGLVQDPLPAVLYQELPELPFESLTVIDENLNVRPSQASSWSNISPLVWEFQLNTDRSSGFKSQDIIRSFEVFETQDGSKAILGSLSEIITLNPQHIQMITKTPDPLLAHKMSKVPLLRQEQPSDQLIVEPNRLRTDESILHASLSFPQEDHIKQKRYDNIVEPPPGLWPLLFQNDYVIEPAINTESVFLVARRGEEGLTSDVVLSLATQIQGGSLLQTSYFQYGQLADQFVPPGITGYTPDLRAQFPSQNTSENAEEEKGSITLHSPKEEERVANSIASLLMASGYEVSQFSYDPSLLENHLENNRPDLLLVSLEFSIGDMAPFLDAFVDSQGILNLDYKNSRVDELIASSRRELNRFERLQMLQEISQIITHEDPVGIPLLFKRSFSGVKKTNN